ncbi:hypothetical protein QZH41_003004 [Actinostola sp. cb2023]|nr:hypothetical protein QZH41_003004 [Actinostola sp. cb2023]
MIHKGDKCHETSKRRQEKWLGNLSLKSEGVESPNARVCSDHFAKDGLDPTDKTGMVSIACQTHLTVDHIEAMEEDINNLKSEIYNLRAKALDTELSKESFQDKDDKTKFYTDSWKDCLPWPQERHTVIKIFADASDSAWGGTIQTPGSPSTSLRDYWPEHLAHCPIMIKEAYALVFTLRAARYSITNAHLDVHTDNMAFMFSWRKQEGKNSQFKTAIKELHLILWESSASMTRSYVPSSANPADAPSRVLSEKDPPG